MSGFYFSVLAAAGGSVAFLFCLWFFQLSSYRAAEYTVLFRTGKGINAYSGSICFSVLQHLRKFCRYDRFGFVF